MLISELGEFGLIDRISRDTATDELSVVVGIGDDVAVLRATGERYLLATCDIQVEGVHFLREKITPYQLGRKAVAINLSDIAAMGGCPKHLLVSLVLTPETTVEYVDALYEGIREEVGRAGVNIVGGNMANSPSQLMVDIFLLGEVEPDRLLLRSRARPGDSILVTGCLGASAAGLALLREPSFDDQGAMSEEVKEAHLTPTPRLREGRVISASRVATSMIDVSDGLSSDLGHICEASEIGAEVWASSLPISPATQKIAHLMGKDPLGWALFGGEDYELIFTAPQEEVGALATALVRETGTQAKVIGQTMPLEKGMTLVRESGERVPLRTGGWDHFRGEGGSL